MDTKKTYICPNIPITIQGKEADALIDCGSEVTGISGSRYHTKENGLQKCPKLPTPAFSIKGAFGGKCKRIKEQILCDTKIGNTKIDTVFLVIDGLKFDVVLGIDWLEKNKIKMDFGEKKMTLPGGEIISYKEVTIEDEDAIEDLRTLASLKVEPEDQEGSDLNEEKEEKEPALEGLNHKQKRAIKKLLKKYKNVFSEKIGRAKGFKYKFKMEKGRPYYKAPNYPIPFKLLDRVREHINTWIKEDIIEEYNTPYINPLVVAPKKNGDIRACLDARKVNENMIPDHEPLPNIDAILSKIGKAKYLTSFDMQSAFLQLPLSTSSKKYTGFIFDGKTYVFKRVPFGTKNSMAALTRCLNFIFDGKYRDHILVFADDILIASATFEEHLQHLEYVLKKFAEHGITLNQSKFKFCKKELTFLGHKIMVTEEGSNKVYPDPEKLKALEDFPRPTNQRTLKGFIGLALFFSKFRSDFAEVTNPLNELLRKNVRWHWKQEHEEAFLKTKAMFKDMYLHLPDFNGDLILQTDASDHTISAWLSQRTDNKLGIIGCVSRSLKGAELKYTIIEKELLAIVFGLEKFRQYLLYRKFDVRTDNQALCFIKRTTYVSSRINRWIMKIQNFDFSITHCQGKENTVADILTRINAGKNWDDITDGTILISSINIVSKEEFETWLKKIKNQKGKKIPSNIPSKTYEGLKFFQVGKVWKLWVPENLLEELIELMHIEWGHCGIYRLYKMLQRYILCKNIMKHVKRKLRSCEICQKVKGSSSTKKLENIVPKKPNEIWGADFYGPLRQSGRHKYKYIFLVMDLFSKFSKLFPIKRATAEECIKKIKRFCFPTMGKPKTILTDQGRQFISHLWKAFLNKQGIRHCKTSVMHPMTNGGVERMNRETTKFLRIYCYKQHHKWSSWVKKIEHIINNSVSTSTGCTPNELHFCHAPEFYPLSLIPILKPKKLNHREILKKAKKNFKKEALKRSRYYNLRNKANNNNSLREGDSVLLRKNPFQNPRKDETPKLIPRFEGPYHIVKKIRNNTFLIKIKNRLVQTHANQLKLFQHSTKEKQK